ncbi:hypothetical protein IX307_001001 [Bacteroides pyogenes]|nr:hypothetical protein [Bacteroides pyogenes]MBR8786688.1 hypothetical protein [Bacteroides pyogenes]MBR8792202.1 hypothetical protein [Bacteroides pyogenes]
MLHTAASINPATHSIYRQSGYPSLRFAFVRILSKECGKFFLRVATSIPK